MLWRAHPTRIFVDSAAILWVVYFIWQQLWLPAVAITLLASATSYFLIRKTSLEALASTTLGRLALLHLHPVNLTLQTLSVPPLLYGLWNHSTGFILAGLSLLLLGHASGWSKVHPSLAQNPAFVGTARASIPSARGAFIAGPGQRQRPSPVHGG